MVNYTSLLGLPVLGQNNETIGTVYEVLWENDNKVILGLLICGKKILSKKYFVPIDSILSINKTNIEVDNRIQIQILSKSNDVYKTLIQNSKPKLESKVYTSNGIKEGYMKDIVFNFEVGLIDSFIIGNGFIQDLLTGRKVVCSENTVIKRDSLIVKEKKDKY